MDPQEDTRLFGSVGMTFVETLSAAEMVLLDGRCTAKTQAKIDLLKEAASLADRHGLGLAPAYFIARVVELATRTGRISFVRVEMTRCPVTGKRAELRKPKKATRDNPWKMATEIPFYGYEFEQGFVVVRHSPKLGISAEGLECVRPYLLEELKSVKAEIPERLLGHPSPWIKESIIICTGCGWTGREGLADNNRIRGRRLCPGCGRRSDAASHYTIAKDDQGLERFEIVRAPEVLSLCPEAPPLPMMPTLGQA